MAQEKLTERHPFQILQFAFVGGSLRWQTAHELHIRLGEAGQERLATLKYAPANGALQMVDRMTLDVYTVDPQAMLETITIEVAKVVGIFVMAAKWHKPGSHAIGRNWRDLMAALEWPKDTLPICTKLLQRAVDLTPIAAAA